MAGEKISSLTTIAGANLDLSNDLVPVVDVSEASDEDKNKNFTLGGMIDNWASNTTSTLSNKTLDNSNSATLLDTNFTLQDDGDNTKQLDFQLSGISTSTTRTLTVPDADDTIAVLGTAQTFTATQTVDADISLSGSVEMTTTGPLLIGKNHGSSQGDESIAIGKGARALEDTGGTLANNDPRATVIGFEAGNNTGSGVFGLTATGYQAAQNNTGDRVTASGYAAAQNNTGDRVTASGFRAAQGNTGNRVTATGLRAALNNTKDDVVAVGHFALRGDGITASNMGARAVAVGSEAGRDNTGDDCVLLGYQAGNTNSNNNRFIVQNKNVNATALIDADFSSGDVTWLAGGTHNLGDATDIQFGTTTGTKFGTSSSQLIGKWGVTPIAQPSSSGETAGFTQGSGTSVNDDSTFTGNTGSTAYTISDIVKHLKNTGEIAA